MGTARQRVEPLPHYAAIPAPRPALLEGSTDAYLALAGSHGRCFRSRAALAHGKTGFHHHLVNRGLPFVLSLIGCDHSITSGDIELP